MDLVLTRLEYRPDGIFGELRDLNNVLVARTLEHSYPLDGEGGYYPKIPPGLYLCVRGIHQLEGMSHPFETFELQNVPGHVNILIHWGNWNRDSAGCILIGKELGQSAQGQMITDSRAVFEQFMQIEQGQQTFNLSVLG